MKIKFESFGRSALGKHRPGSVEDLPEAEALVFLNKGYAKPVKDTCSETAELKHDGEETAEAKINTAPPLPRTGKKKKKRK